MRFKITTDVPGLGEVPVAEADDYQFARTIARLSSAETGGSYTVTPNAPMRDFSETFSNGRSEG